jgi:CubicO group peptidase (beta-lactamase class C family)
MLRTKLLNSFIKVLILLIFTLSGLLGFANPTMAQSIEAESPGNAQVNRIQDVGELEAFLDDFFGEQMAELHIPGAAIAIVKDGSILFTKGYGYADLDNQTPVIPDQTLFRVGSVSKTLTGTAAMQLVDRGLIQLDEDINQYLKAFQIPDTYPQPITLKHLLTHTSGFSQQYIGIAGRTAEDKLSLAEYVKTEMPPRVRPPGEHYSYSTYDSDLVGYIIEEITGVPLEEYMEQNLLQPLQMQDSSFWQPLPPALDSNLAVGYEYEDGTYKTVPFLYLNTVAAGAMSATATDIAHFMLAQLQGGQYDNQRILSEDSTRAMQQQHFTDHPKLPGIGYTFHERFKNQQRILAHSAIFLGYTSLIFLIPEQNLGIFITYNLFEPTLHERLILDFLDHYYPVTEETPVPEPPGDFDQRVDRFVGTYRHIEYPAHTPTKLSSVLNHVSVRKNDNQGLIVNFPNGFFAETPEQDKVNELIEVEPLLFYRVNRDDYVAFAADEWGKISYMYHPLDLGPAGFERLPWYETTYFHVPALLFFLGVFLSGFWMWPVRYWKNSQDKPQFLRDRFTRQAWLIAGLVSTLNLVFPIALGLVFWAIDPMEFLYGFPIPIAAVLYLPVVAAGLSLALPFLTAIAWIRPTWSIRERLHYTGVTLGAFGFIAFLNYWNLWGLAV